MTGDNSDLNRMLRKLDGAAEEEPSLPEAPAGALIPAHTDEELGIQAEQALDEFLDHALRIAISEAPRMSSDEQLAFTMGFFNGWRIGLEQAACMIKGMSKEVPRK